jgi:hypothetical protein
VDLDICCYITRGFISVIRKAHLWILLLKLTSKKHIFRAKKGLLAAGLDHVVNGEKHIAKNKSIIFCYR